MIVIKEKIKSIIDGRIAKKRKKYTSAMSERLKNKDFSLISNNCNGGVLSHELGLRFNSQFVNLAIFSEEYIKYLENFDYYNSLVPEFEETQESYPVGVLDDIKIHFIHYKTKQEALEKWEERKKRINKDNLFVIFTEQHGVDECPEELLRRFDKLPFKNKIVFTCKEYEDIKSSVYVKQFKNNPYGVYMFLSYRSRLSYKRRYDVFDFVSWFNGETDLKKLIK